MALVATALLSGVLPSVVAAVDAQEPYMFVRDAPFVRSNVVDLEFVSGSSGQLVTRLASNDPATTNGILTNGVSVPYSGMWTLAAGADGLRTIYGQVKLASGEWLPVMSLSLVLDTSPASSFYADRDPRSLIEAGVHQYVTTPGSLVGVAQPAGTQDHARFQVIGPRMSLTLHTPGNAITPGEYEAVVDGTGACDTVCADVSTGTEGCSATGTVTVHEISFHASGDVETVAADYRLTCLPKTVFSGSVRYGSIRGVAAVSPNVDWLTFGNLEVGQQAGAQTVTLTNIGTVSNDLGTATVEAGPNSDESADYRIVADGCSGEPLSLGESCSLSVEFEPTARGLRQASLVIPDETARGGRMIKLAASATQPTTLELVAQEVPEFGPAEATFDAVVSPAGPGYARLFVDGVQQFGATEETLENPSRIVTRYVVTLEPGQHEVSTDFTGLDGMLDSSTDSIQLDVGVETWLDLSTSTDDGVATGEAAELRAQLWSGGPVAGTLRIRDGITDAVLATAVVSGDDPQLLHSVTRGQGSHSFTAEFLPASATFQAATDSYALVVVNGPRPETLMTSEPLYSTFWKADGTFSSPTPGAATECKVGPGTNWHPCFSPMVFSWNQTGVVQIAVRARLPNGLADRTPATRLWYIDEDPPVASVPSKRFVTGSSIVSGRVPLRVTWSATDAETGIGSYRLDQSTDGGTFSAAATSLTKPTIDRPLTTQHNYRLGGRALDKAGNLSSNAAGSTFTLSRYIESSSRIRYSGTWRTASSTAYWGGVARYASTAGAKAAFTSTGRAIAWVARKGPTRGKAEIFVNGAKVATVDLYASSYQNQRVVWSTSWASAATRTVTIRVVGTSGRPRVDLDAILTTN